MADGFALKVNRVAESLSREEHKTVLYLCSDLLAGQCVEDLRGALISITDFQHRGDAILKELIFRMKRFDILRRVLGSSREEVEVLLRQGGVLSGYRVLMVELSENLEAEELSSLIFLLSNSIPKEHLTRATTFLDVVVELEKLDEVSCERLQIIEKCLKQIRRADLVKKIHSYQKGPQLKQGSQSSVQNGAQFKAKLNHRHQTQAEQWQRLGQGFENLKLSQPESGVQQTPVDECYISSELRGVCVIIDCIGIDGVLMERTFQQLGFRVSLHSLLGSEETFSVLRSVTQRRDLQQASAFACCLLSRASDDACLLATDATACPGLPRQELRRLFNSERCPLLVGKPKLFFTQSYVSLGQTPDHRPSSSPPSYLETDGIPSCLTRRQPAVARETIPTDADVLWSWCSTRAELLERRSHTSMYLSALSAALLRAHERRHHVLDALTEVNKHVFEHNQRNPNESYDHSLSHTLRKTLYL